MDTRPNLTSTRRWLAWGLVFVLVWGGVIGLFAAQWVIMGSASWREAVRLAIPFWGLWIAASPLVVWVSLRWPVEAGRIGSRIGLHLAACSVLVFGYQLLTRDVPPGPGPAGSPRLWPELRPDGAPRPRGGGRRFGPPRPVLLRITMDIVVYWAIVSGCHAVTFFRRAQDRERTASELRSRLAQARLDSLRGQLNPHFLFNTLNAISALIHLRPDAADEMIASLSELLRASLDTAQIHEVPLRREMEILNHYLEIEQTRFGERLHVEMDIPPETFNAMVPTLILQPLVENSIRHGIEPRLAPGVVRIVAARREDTLTLSVEDDGSGPRDAADGGPAERQPEARAGIAGNSLGRADGMGIGIANTRARLAALYGERQQFSMGRGAKGGWLVTLEIPWRTEPSSGPDHAG